MSIASLPYMQRKRDCLFDPARLYKITQLGVGLPTEEAFARIGAALAEAYPGHINTRHDWVFNVAGGAMGQMTFLHGSLREYIIFFGSCNGVEDHSGRYSSEVFDFVFKGEMRGEYEGRFEPEIHGPGSISYLGASAVKHYRIKDEAWMLEYARGDIPAMLPFGLADSFTSTLDAVTIARTLRSYGRLVVQELLTHRKDLDLAAYYGLGAATVLSALMLLPRLTKPQS
jgi:hypothetical protein